MDKRWQLYKHIEAKGIVFESVRPRDYELPAWISEYARSKGFTLDAKAAAMLTDHLGADIAKMTNELGKLLTYLPQGTRTVTAEQIEANIGISKDFNNFELTKSLSEKNMAKAMQIARPLRAQPERQPAAIDAQRAVHAFPAHLHRQLPTLALAAQRNPDALGDGARTDAQTAQRFFSQRVHAAASAYPNNKVFMILGLLREYDLKSKGMNTGQADDGELLKELLLKILIL